jgi:hypothetical protein
MVADPITGREFRVRTNSVVVAGEVKPKLPAKPKASRPVIKGRTGSAQTNRLLSDWRDETRKEARGSGIAHAPVALRRMAHAVHD